MARKIKRLNNDKKHTKFSMIVAQVVNLLIIVLTTAIMAKFWKSYTGNPLDVSSFFIILFGLPTAFCVLMLAVTAAQYGSELFFKIHYKASPLYRDGVGPRILNGIIILTVVPAVVPYLV